MLRVSRFFGLYCIEGAYTTMQVIFDNIYVILGENCQIIHFFRLPPQMRFVLDDVLV